MNTEPKPTFKTANSHFFWGLAVLGPFWVIGIFWVTNQLLPTSDGELLKGFMGGALQWLLSASGGGIVVGSVGKTLQKALTQRALAVVEAQAATVPLSPFIAPTNPDKNLDFLLEPTDYDLMASQEDDDLPDADSE